MSQAHRLGDLQLAIVNVLWRRGEGTVADVHEALRAERGLALTTIATMLRKMEQKGVVKHRKQGRALVYRACVRPEQVHRTMVGDLVERLFGGDPLALVNHLVQEGEIDDRELEDLRRRVREAARRRRGGSGGTSKEGRK